MKRREAIQQRYGRVLRVPPVSACHRIPLPAKTGLRQPRVVSIPEHGAGGKLAPGFGGGHRAGMWWELACEFPLFPLRGKLCPPFSTQHKNCVSWKHLVLQQGLHHLYLETGVVWYGLCGGVLLAVTAGCLKQCGSQEVSVEGLAEGKCSEVESEGPDQTLLSFKSHYSHGA